MRRLAPFAVGAALVACGGAQAPASAPLPEPKTPTTIEEAEAQIREAEAQLAPPGAAPAAPKAEATTTAEPAARGTQSTGSRDDAHDAEARAERDACRTSCRALGSMRRAVEALCRMSGDADARCTDARATLARNEARTAGCGC